MELTVDFSSDATREVIEDARFKQQEHLHALAAAVPGGDRIQYPHTARFPVRPLCTVYKLTLELQVEDKYQHGAVVVDNYRWLEVSNLVIFLESIFPTCSWAGSRFARDSLVVSCVLIPRAGNSSTSCVLNRVEAQNKITDAYLEKCK